MKILIIDDNFDYANLLKDGFEKRGHSAKIEIKPLKGVETAIEIKPDLIILDVFMPRENGFQISQELKNYEATKNIPVIMMSGMTDHFETFADNIGHKFIDKSIGINNILKVCEAAVL